MPPAFVWSPNEHASDMRSVSVLTSSNGWRLTCALCSYSSGYSLGSIHQPPLVRLRAESSTSEECGTATGEKRYGYGRKSGTGDTGGGPVACGVEWSRAERSEGRSVRGAIRSGGGGAVRDRAVRDITIRAINGPGEKASIDKTTCAERVRGEGM